MGADYIFNSKDPETSQKILALCNDKGADSVVDFVNAPPTVKLGLAILRKRGNLVLVGLFGGSIELSSCYNSAQINYHTRCIYW